MQVSAVIPRDTNAISATLCTGGTVTARAEGLCPCAMPNTPLLTRLVRLLMSFGEDVFAGSALCTTCSPLFADFRLPGRFCPPTATMRQLESSDGLLCGGWVSLSSATYAISATGENRSWPHSGRLRLRPDHDHGGRRRPRRAEGLRARKDRADTGRRGTSPPVHPPRPGRNLPGRLLLPPARRHAGRARIIAQHFELLRTVPHHHHHAEDTYLWPRILSHAGRDEGPVVAARRYSTGSSARSARTSRPSCRAGRKPPGAGRPARDRSAGRRADPAARRHRGPHAAGSGWP
jgi:hypothetical protein